MDATGHEILVTKVNAQLPRPFPPDELCAGAVQPDTEAAGRYTDNEYKHHYDEGAPGVPRRDAAGIRDTVWRKIAEARRHWLSGNEARAAICFGVASHYLVDGLTVSLEVDESAFKEADAAFTEGVNNLPAPQMERPDLADSRYAEAALQEVVPLFGRNRPEDLPAACQALFRIGLAVTEELHPDRLLAKAEEHLARLREFVDRELAAYDRQSHESARRCVRDLWADAKNGLQDSSFCIKGIALAGDV